MLRSLTDLWDRLRRFPDLADQPEVVKETPERTEALFAAGMLRKARDSGDGQGLWAIELVLPPRPRAGPP